MKNLFKRALCLHEWVQGNSAENPFPKIRYSIGARAIWVCKKCGKVTLYPN
jgi:hypothetical protein